MLDGCGRRRVDPLRSTQRPGHARRVLRSGRGLETLRPGNKVKIEVKTRPKVHREWSASMSEHVLPFCGPSVRGPSMSAESTTRRSEDDSVESLPKTHLPPGCENSSGPHDLAARRTASLDHLLHAVQPYALRVLPAGCDGARLPHPQTLEMRCSGGLSPRTMPQASWAALQRRVLGP